LEKIKNRKSQFNNINNSYTKPLTKRKLKLPIIQRKNMFPIVFQNKKKIEEENLLLYKKLIRCKSVIKYESDNSLYPYYLENSRKFSEKKLNNTKNILIESFKGSPLLKNAINNSINSFPINNNVNNNKKNKNYVLIKNIRKTFFDNSKFLDGIKKSTNYSNYSSFDLKLTKNSIKSGKKTIL